MYSPNDSQIGIRFRVNDTVIDLNDHYLKTRVLLDTYIPNTVTSDSVYVTESATVYCENKETGLTLMNQLMGLFTVANNGLSECYFEFRQNRYSEWLQARLVRDNSGISGTCQIHETILNNFTSFIKFDVVWNRYRYLQTKNRINIPFSTPILEVSSPYFLTPDDTSPKVIQNIAGYNYIHLPEGVVEGTYPSVPTIEITNLTENLGGIEKIFVANRTNLTPDKLNLFLEGEDAINGIAVVPNPNSSNGAYASYLTTMGGSYAFEWVITPEESLKYLGQTFRPLLVFINSYKPLENSYSSFAWVLSDTQTGKVFYKSRFIRVTSEINHLFTNDLTFPFFPEGLERSLTLSLVFQSNKIPDAFSLDYVMFNPTHGIAEIKNTHGLNVLERSVSLSTNKPYKRVLPFFDSQLSITGGVSLYPRTSNTLYFTFLGENNNYNSLFKFRAELSYQPTYIF